MVGDMAFKLGAVVGKGEGNVGCKDGEALGDALGTKVGWIVGFALGDADHCSHMPEFPGHFMSPRFGGRHSPEVCPNPTQRNWSVSEAPFRYERHAQVATVWVHFNVSTRHTSSAVETLDIAFFLREQRPKQIFLFRASGLERVRGSVLAASSIIITLSSGACQRVCF